MSRQSYHSPNWGGARTGAGRPCKKPLPPTDIRALDPEKFISPAFYLLCRMHDPVLPSEYRDQIALQLLPFFCPKLKRTEHRSLSEIAASLSDEQLDQMLLRYGVAEDATELPPMQ